VSLDTISVLKNCDVNISDSWK